MGCLNYLAPLSGLGLQSGKVLVKVKFGCDLNLDKELPFCNFIISNVDCICMDSMCHNVHLDVL